MGVKITFTPGSDVYDGHRIYRSETSFAGVPRSQLPAPLVELPFGVTEWEDGTVFAGGTFYYLVAAFLGSAQAAGPEIEVVAEGGEVQLQQAIVSFTTDSVPQAPVNRALWSAGLPTILALDGLPTPWSLEYVSGTPTGGFYDTSSTYSGLPWPASPLVDGSEDYNLAAGNVGQATTLRIAGLDPLMAYDIHFTGSRMTTGSRYCQVTIAGDTKSFDANNNQDKELLFPMLRPDEAGQIAFTLDVRQWNYLSAFWIEERLPDGD